MEMTTIKIGRLSVTLLGLTDQQIANVFGISAYSSLTPPEVPQGSTQEEAYIGSAEYKAAYDQYATDINRLESVGFVAAARDPILIELQLGPDNPLAGQMRRESDDINATAARFGFIANEKYPIETLEAQKIALIAEKSAKFFPEGLTQINQFAADCMKRTGFVGGAAIDAEIKSAEADLPREGLDQPSSEGAQQTEDSVREALPSA